MKLNKKTETEVIKVYETWLNAYINGDITTYDLYLDDSYHFIGSTNNEEFLNKKDTTTFFEKTADQLAGKTDLKNRIKTIEIFEGLVFITEFFDAFFLISNEWVYYGRFRFTSVMRKNKEGWRFIYQHFSMPDSKAQEGETLGAEQISKENQELRDAIKRRTVELEEKNRQLEIETALERVRARTMAMQKSEELSEVATVLFQQVGLLGIPQWTCGFNIWETGDTHFTFYPGGPDGEILASCKVSLTEHPIFRQFDESKKRGDELLVYEKEGEIQADHYRYMHSLPGIGDMLQGMLDSGLEFPTYQIDHVANFLYGNIIFITYKPFPEMHDVFKRFAKVFEQTYTRFLDLQKAEKQTREGQINLAVERVRAKALAMHKSEEILEVVAKLKDEVMALDIPNVIAATIFLNHGEDKVRMWDLSSLEKLEEGYQVPLDITFKLKEKDPHLYVKQVWENPENYFVEIQDEKGFKRIMEWLREYNKKEVADEVEAYLETAKIKCLYHAAKKLNNGKLVLDLLDPPAAEIETILTKMGAAFDLAYKRFEDLQKAEAQAREARIEGALERVRSKTMAMHNSKDLEAIVITLFEEVLNLGLDKSMRCGIGILEGHEGMETRSVNSNADGTVDLRVGMLNMTIHPMLVGLKKAWKNGSQEYSYEYTRNDLKKYYEVLNKEPEYPFNANLEKLPKQEFHRSFFFSSGIIFAFSADPISEESSNILSRFAAVFGQAYRRFLDLQKAEAQTREAQIEVALERVRARALAMQKPEELKEVAEVLRQEMGILGVEELETCSIYITDMQTDQAECWYALKDSRNTKKKLINDYFSLNLKDTWVGRKMFSFYKLSQKQTSIVMAGANRKEWIRYCEANSTPFRGYYGDEIPDRTYHLYKFSHGAIGAASTGEISDESWGLLKRAASVFSLAYSRFKDLTQARIDLQKLKEEKQRAQEALSELQTTQKQLIQSEKMASLGELTAGIAHEIQNPLNFVNNFSEVSKELLDEMKEELDNGNLEEAMEIMQDIIQNLEKINHHGKRADGIVKGMLQHSRSSSGSKEPTDINELADEYLRLAYHGLRAKDKSFNATMVSDFDQSIGNVNVIPQDIGRVILNLITNAFYVVDEKKKSGIENYEPTVTVRTKKGVKNLEIQVSDNGDGIPEKILNKIFEPFFTTKPTGKGTGLGLSMSYDIITKGHGGELKVQTKEGEGTQFIVVLPINNIK